MYQKQENNYFWLVRRTSHTSYPNQSLLQCEVLIVYRSLCMLALANPNAPPTLHWKNVKTQQLSVILGLSWEYLGQGSHMIIVTSMFSKSPVFKRCSVHTKAGKLAFLIPPVWRAFSKTSVFVTDLCALDGTEAYNRRNKPAFSNSLCVVWALPKKRALQTQIRKSSPRLASFQGKACLSSSFFYHASLSAHITFDSIKL